MDHKGELVTFERANGHLLQQPLLHACDGSTQEATQTEGQSGGGGMIRSPWKSGPRQENAASAEQRGACAVFTFRVLLHVHHNNIIYDQKELGLVLWERCE